MNSDQLKNLFKPFTQAEGAVNRQHGGLGLNLAYCKSLVTMMGGEIWAVSELERGSTFFFTIKFGWVAGDSTQTSSDYTLLPPGKAENEDQPPRVTPDRDALNARMLELTNLLQINDIQAETVFAAVKETLQSIMPDKTAELARQLAIFDFKGALKSLQNIAASLEQEEDTKS